MQGDDNSVREGFYHRITIIVQIMAKINNFEYVYANTLMHTSHSAFVKFAKSCYFKKNHIIFEICPLVQPKMKIDTMESNHKFITISIRTNTLQLSKRKEKKKC